MMVIIKQLEHSADLFHTKFRSHEVLSCFSCVCCRLISGAAAAAAYHHACHKHTQHIHNTTQRKHIYHHICISYIPKIVTHWELQVYGDMTRSWLSICWWLCCSFIWQWSTFIFSTFSKKLKFFPKLFSFSPSLSVELIFCTEKSLNIIKVVLNLSLSSKTAPLESDSQTPEFDSFQSMEGSEWKIWVCQPDEHQNKDGFCFTESYTFLADTFKVSEKEGCGWEKTSEQHFLDLLKNNPVAIGNCPSWILQQRSFWWSLKQ